MTDNELLDMLLNDPQRGLEQVVRAYTPYVMKIVRIKLSGLCTEADAEEIVSDIFMMLYLRVTRGSEAVRSLKALLAVIARRRCADAYEQLKNQGKHIPLEELSESVRSGPPEDDKAILLEALHSLGQPDEQIFFRKYFFGQQSKEIAAELGMKANTVDKRISRGLKKLKAYMEER